MLHVTFIYAFNLFSANSETFNFDLIESRMRIGTIAILHQSIPESIDINSQTKTKLSGLFRGLKYKYFIVATNILSNVRSKYICLNPNGAGAQCNVPTLFSEGYFSMKKGTWRSEISWPFQIHYKISENQKPHTIRVNDT